MEIPGISGSSPIRFRATSYTDADIQYVVNMLTGAKFAFNIFKVGGQPTDYELLATANLLGRIINKFILNPEHPEYKEAFENIASQINSIYGNPTNTYSLSYLCESISKCCSGTSIEDTKQLASLLSELHARYHEFGQLQQAFDKWRPDVKYAYKHETDHWDEIKTNWQYLSDALNNFFASPSQYSMQILMQNIAKAAQTPLMDTGNFDGPELVLYSLLRTPLMLRFSGEPSPSPNNLSLLGLYQYYQQQGVQTYDFIKDCLKTSLYTGDEYYSINNLFTHFLNDFLKE